MIGFLKKFSIVPQGLKYKTMIAFSLMSLIPILIFGWIVVNYIFPNLNLFFDLSMTNISIILSICIFISILGLVIVRQMVDSMVKMAGDARVIADGEIDKLIEIEDEDEIGDLGKSLNLMTQKIRDNIDELRAYGERTKLINLEINKKVLTLSGLLQIGNLISASEEIENILKFITEKICSIEEDSKCAILLSEDKNDSFMVVAEKNCVKSKAKKIIVKKKNIFADIAVIDKNADKELPEIRELINSLNFKNAIILPVIMGKKLKGLLVAGNNTEDFSFKDDTKELLKVFVKQINIAIENDLLIRKAKELAVMDELTGLYNENYIHTRLDEEIKRACMYQRPCGYLMIDIDNFKDFYEELGETKSDELLRSLAEFLKKSVSEVDKVGRLKADEFGIVLLEKNKRQAAGIAEDIRKEIEDNLSKQLKLSKKMTVSIGVSENPIDGSTANELMKKAEELVKSAKSLGRNRVAV